MLQRFVIPSTSQNHTFKVAISEGHISVSKRINHNTLPRGIKDKNVDRALGEPQLQVYESIVTYEGAPQMSSEDRVSAATEMSEIREIVDQVIDHFAEMGTQITQGDLYLKQD